MPRKKAVKAAKTDNLAPEMEKQEPVQDSIEQIREPSVEPQLESQLESKIEAQDSIEEINEDVAIKAPPKRNIPRFPETHKSDKDAEGCHCYDSSFPKGKLPPPPILQRRELEDAEMPKPKQGKDGIDKAMEILDQYYEGTPLRDPNVDHGGED
jgi:hypothetical protein